MWFWSRLRDFCKEKSVAFNVESGWHSDENSLISEALGRYLDCRREDIAEQQILNDLEWVCGEMIEAVLDAGPIIHLSELEILEILNCIRAFKLKSAPRLAL